MSESVALAEEEHPRPEEIKVQLQAILASPVFHGSKRCHEFLEYVCEKSLSGEVGALKERTIAIEIFGRAPGSDLAEDTIVRVSAREVRKRLAQFYVTPEGSASAIRIDLPPGAYAPEFRYAHAHPQPTIDTHLEATKADTLRQPWILPVFHVPVSRRLTLTAAVLSVILAAASVTTSTIVSRRAEPFTKFWAPVFNSSGPLLLVVASPIVYHPSRRALRLSEANQPPEDIPTQRVLQVAPNLLDGSDMVPVLNQYVGFGDMIAATEVSTMLAQKSRAVRVRMASSAQFSDLRETPTLLIGSITNRWTMELQQAWRFQFIRIPGVRIVIVDTQDPAAKNATPETRRHWGISSKEDGTAQEDYILISRLRNSSTGGTLLVAAGLKQFGTEAAGRILAEPNQLNSILRQLPSGWENKNLQVVLHAKVIGNAPAQPDVVASHVW